MSWFVSAIFIGIIHLNEPKQWGFKQTSLIYTSLLVVAVTVMEKRLTGLFKELQWSEPFVRLNTETEAEREGEKSSVRLYT